MRISDWMSDVCSSDLADDDSHHSRGRAQRHVVGTHEERHHILMDGETGESRRSTCRRTQRIASFGQQRSHGGEEADGWYLCRGPGRFTHRQAKDERGDKANADRKSGVEEKRESVRE